MVIVLDNYIPVTLCLCFRVLLRTFLFLLFFSPSFSTFFVCCTGKPFYLGVYRVPVLLSAAADSAPAVTGTPIGIAPADTDTGTGTGTTNTKTKALHFDSFFFSKFQSY